MYSLYLYKLNSAGLIKILANALVKTKDASNNITGQFSVNVVKSNKLKEQHFVLGSRK